MDGAFQIINGKGQCLGIAGGSTDEGADVVSYQCYPGHPDQYWFLASTGCGSHEWWFDNYSTDIQDFSMGVAGGSKANGANVVEWAYQQKCNNQVWEFLGA